PCAASTPTTRHENPRREPKIPCPDVGCPASGAGRPAGAAAPAAVPPAANRADVDLNTLPRGNWQAGGRFAGPSAAAGGTAAAIPAVASLRPEKIEGRARDARRDGPGNRPGSRAGDGDLAAYGATRARRRGGGRGRRRGGPRHARRGGEGGRACRRAR